MEVKKVCALCGAEFSVPHWREHKAKFCSRACSDESKRASPNHICAICGKPFHRKPYHSKRCKGKFGFCCSRKCLAQLKVAMMSGENNHQFGLKGELNSSFKVGNLYHKNNKLDEFFIYVGSWYLKYSRNGRIPEHRYLVELHHSSFNEEFFDEIEGWFYLKDGYEVHHKDSNHNNNALSNLQVLTKGEHISLHNKLRHQKRNAQGKFIKSN